MYLHNHSLDPVELKAEDPHLDWFRMEMDRYKSQHEDCLAMRVDKRVGLFLVQTKKLKDTFTPSNTGCLNHLQALLPVIAREKNELLLEEITEAVGRLNKSPANVEEFVVYLEFHTKVWPPIVTLAVPKIAAKQGSCLRLSLAKNP